MSDALGKLFNDFDRGLISRRHLLQVLGVAVVARPAMAFAQGSCGGARASLPECDTTPAKAPRAAEAEAAAACAAEDAGAEWGLAFGSKFGR